MAAGPRIDRGILSFDFKPSIGIMAAQVNKLGLDIRSFREPLTRSVKEVMIPSFRLNFESGGRPSWEPLTDTTAAIRDREGYGSDGPILVRTGKLAKTATQLNIWSITENYAIIKSLPAYVWYGKLHQSGLGGASSVGAVDKQIRDALKSGNAIKGGAHIPARPFVVMQEEDADDIHNVFDKWIAERALRSGGFIPVGG